MQDTITSKCCTIYKTIYLDNLKAENWEYGNISAEEYEK